MVVTNNITPSSVQVRVEDDEPPTLQDCSGLDVVGQTDQAGLDEGILLLSLPNSWLYGESLCKKRLRRRMTDNHRLHTQAASFGTTAVGHVSVGMDCGGVTIPQVRKTPSLPRSWANFSFL